jgi:type II secretory pathway pseudopilin PulG
MKKRGGLTLLELTIAMAIFMVLVGAILIGTRGNNKDYRVLHNASRMLQADMRYAQRRAIMEGRRIGVHFNIADNSYSVVAAVSPTRVTALRTIHFPDGVDLASVSGNLDNRIMFLPRGTAVPGTILLRNGVYEQRITTTLGGGRVHIFPITSRN